jgi:hypothetical protein
MLAIAVIFFIISTYIGYYHNKSIMLSVMDPLYAPFWALVRTDKGNRNLKWLILIFQYLSITICLSIVYYILILRNTKVLLIICILAGIFIASYLISLFWPYRYMKKNHKAAYEAYWIRRDSFNMFK